jgi:FemAB-related protein (PEP-CTERM system-associated)
VDANGQTGIELLGDEAAAEWDAYAMSAPGASFYHRYRWRNVIRDVFDRDTFYFAARQGGRLCGVLPVVRLKSRFFGDFLISMPYLNYGGVVGDSAEIEQQLIARGSQLAQELGVAHLELRHRQPKSESLPVRTDKVTMLLDLPASAEALMKTLPSKLRSQVKRPQKEGAVAEHGGAELLNDFYAVFAENMRDLGTPVYPRRFFAAMLSAFPLETRIFVVRLAGAPVAAGFVIGDRGVLEIPWASSLRRANGVGVNMLLYWSMLEFACERGYATFDFGRCTVDSGTYRFKKQWGAQASQLYWHYWMREAGEPPRLNHSNPKYEAAVAAWRRLPLAVANRLGPLLIRNLP